MAEYIEREAAIKAIRNDVMGGLNAEFIVNKLPAADVRPVEWIPVTEQLPQMIDGENISKEVYVTDGTDIAETCLMRDYDGFTSWGYAGIGKITHWCEHIPLPQPPKEE